MVIWTGLIPVIGMQTSSPNILSIHDRNRMYLGIGDALTSEKPKVH